MTKLPSDVCLKAIERGEFPGETATAFPRVAIILTQSWCPQWTAMKGYLETMRVSDDTGIFWVEYDNEPFFEDFMEFKETIFKNREIPYVRYYRGGILVKESNYVSKERFLQNIDS